MGGSRRSGAPGTTPRVGEPDWRRLYDELGELVFRLLHRMTGDEELARDLTHDTFVRAFDRSGQFRGLGSRRGWIFQIAANLAREHGRRASRRSEILERGAPDFDRVARSPGPQVEARAVLADALARLPEDQRTALLLFEVDGYGHAEIARMTGVAEGSSRARVSRAKATLREMLEGRI